MELHSVARHARGPYLGCSHKCLPSFLHCVQLICVSAHISVKLLHVVPVLLHLPSAHGHLLEALLVCFRCRQPLLEGLLLSCVGGQLVLAILDPLEALLNLYRTRQDRPGRDTMLMCIRTYVYAPS